MVTPNLHLIGQDWAPNGLNDEIGRPRPPVDTAVSSRRFCIDAELAAGGPPGPKGLQRLAWEGFSGLLDLRDPRSGASPLDALLEAEEARDAGLSYAWRPFSRRCTEEGEIDAVVAAIRHLPRPLYVQCEDGHAALLLSLMAAGDQRTAGQVFARMAAWGAPLVDSELRDSARAWFATHGLEPHTPASLLAFD